MNIMEKEWGELIREGAAQLGISIDELSLRGFRDHANHLLTWNRKINLTTITDPKEMALKHYVDSLAPLKWIPLPCRVVDIGTGGGFPGIPMKIVRPDLSMTLVDSSRKKTNFLKDAIRVLKLDDISVRHSRIEDLHAQSGFSTHFDVAVMRAFSSLDACVKLALPLLKPDGIILAMKGREVASEIDLVKNTSYADGNGETRKGADLDIQVFSYTLPRTEDGRSLVVIGKN